MAEFINEPQPGYFMVRCCRKCPEVAARIFWNDAEPGVPENKLDQPFLDALIGLDHVPALDVWHRARSPISEAEYHHLFAWLRWAERNAPDHPSFTYRKPVNLEAMPIPRWSHTA